MNLKQKQKQNSNLNSLLKGFVISVSAGKLPATKRRSKCQRFIESIVSNNIQLNSNELAHLWKGIYYAIWYSEMGKGCEEIIQTVVHHANRQILVAGFDSMTREWFVTDSFRLDKLAFLARVCLNKTIQMQIDDALNQKIDTDSLYEELIKNSLTKKQLKVKHTIDERITKNSLIDSILMICSASVGLSIHLAEIYMDEIVKCMSQHFKWKLQQKQIVFKALTLPFIKLLALISDIRLIDSLKKEVFNKLKKDILLRESFELRKSILDHIKTSLISIGSLNEIESKNRSILYSIAKEYKFKLEKMDENTLNSKVKKRKLNDFSLKRRNKKHKIELITNTPFVRSKVPIAVI